MINEQFILTHGTEEFVVLITVSPERKHVWSAKDRKQADDWVDFWSGKETTVMTMNDYLEAGTVKAR